MSERKKTEDQEIFESMVFQGCEARSGPDEMGIFTLSTIAANFTVIITADDAGQMIDELQTFLKGRAAHLAHDDN